MTTNTNQDIPCKKCPVYAICITKERINCEKLLTYAIQHKLAIYPIDALPNLVFLETGGTPLTGYQIKGAPL